MDDFSSDDSNDFNDGNIKLLNKRHESDFKRNQLQCKSSGDTTNVARRIKLSANRNGLNESRPSQALRIQNNQCKQNTLSNIVSCLSSNMNMNSLNSFNTFNINLNQNKTFCEIDNRNKLNGTNRNYTNSHEQEWYMYKKNQNAVVNRKQANVSNDKNDKSKLDQILELKKDISIYNNTNNTNIKIEDHPLRKLLSLLH